MQDVLKLESRVVPEILELLQKRYSILRTIYYSKSIGRRVLSTKIGLGERVVRTEIDFLRKQNLIKVNMTGMVITPEGEEIVHKLKNFIHEIKGLSELETLLQKRLKIKKIIIVPGNVDQDKTVLGEIGRAAANYICTLLKDDIIISLTGGSTVKEVIGSMPENLHFKDILVLPARGGIGTDVSTQANTLVAVLANKINAKYELLHIPDNLSEPALNAMLKEKGINEIVKKIHKSNILIYGIGRADEMARRRGFSKSKVEKIEKLGAVSEVFGYYYDKEGNVVFSTNTVGINNSDINNISTLIAVAGGKRKADAIIANEMNNFNGVLITDEGAAREIVNKLS